MAEILNLKQARKRKARAEKAEVAAQNRILFGRTKSEREQTEAEAELARKRLEAHRREDGNGEGA